MDPCRQSFKTNKTAEESTGLALLFALTLNILTLQYISRLIKLKQCLYDIFHLDSVYNVKQFCSKGRMATLAELVFPILHAFFLI